MKLWIARRKSGRLYIFKEKPCKTDCGKWFTIDGAYVDTGHIIDWNEYPKVTFENSPREVELKLI